MHAPHRVIDVHAHAVLEAGFGATGRHGPELNVDSRGSSSFRVAYAYDESLAVAALVYGGVLERHPDLDVCISHGGGALPFLFGRYEGIARYRDLAPESVRENGFRNEVRKLLFDAHVEGPKALDLLIETVGQDRLAHATNFGGWDTPNATSAFDASLTPSAERLPRLGKFRLALARLRLRPTRHVLPWCESRDGPRPLLHSAA